ncbi:hypothetical protein VYU27_001240 [Nannochloropsis oceanica]
MPLACDVWAWTDNNALPCLPQAVRAAALESHLRNGVRRGVLAGEISRHRRKPLPPNTLAKSYIPVEAQKDKMGSADPSPQARNAFPPV